MPVGDITIVKDGVPSPPPVAEIPDGFIDVKAVVVPKAAVEGRPSIG
jgi:hypothetical protein